jgi:hypothetical protein
MFIDHFVWAAADLRLEMEHFNDITGVRPEFGGSHPGKGTQNALVRLGYACYLEIIAPDPLQRQVDRRWMISKSPISSRLIKWAWTSIDIEEDCRRMGELGRPIGPVSTGKRLRHNGDWLHWQLSDPDYCDSPLVPFLISWNQSRHPANSLPYQCQLKSVKLSHPRPEELRFLELLSESTLTIAKGKEQLLLQMECPKGVMKLSTEAPYYQIQERSSE